MLIILLVSDTIDKTMGYISIPSPLPIALFHSKWTRKFGNNLQLEMSRRPIQSQKNVAPTTKNLPNNKKSNKSRATVKETAARRRLKGRPKKDPTITGEG